MTDPAFGRPLPAPRAFVGLLVSGVCLVAVIFWAMQQEPPEFPDSASELVPIALALVLYAGITVLRGWRWHRMLRLTRISHRQSDAYALTVVGYMGNTVLPARGGELLRVFLLGERTEARRREVLGSIVAERFLDAAALVGLFVVMTWASVAGAPAGQEPALLSVAVAAAGAVLLAGYIVLRRQARFERFAATVRPFVRSTRLVASRTGAVLAMLSVSLWCLEGIVYWLVAESLGLGISPVEGTFVIVLTSFFALIPAAPGFLGTFEAGLAFALSALDVPGGQIVAFAILVRFIVFLPITILGLVFLFSRYGGFRAIRLRSSAKEPAVDSPTPMAEPVKEPNGGACTIPTRSEGDEASRWFRDHYDGAAGEVISFLAEDGISLVGRRVGDIGCGDGIIDLGVAHRAAPARLVGFDVNPTDVGRLSAMAAAEGVDSALPDNLEFRTSAPTSLPAEDDAFDALFTWSAFEHVTDPVSLLREMRRVLTAEGVLMLQLWPFFHSQHGSHLWKWFPEGFAHLLRTTPEIERAVRESADDDPGWAEYMLGEFATLNRITLDELHQALLAGGFHVAKVHLDTAPVHIPPALARFPLSLLAINGAKLLATPS